MSTRAAWVGAIGTVAAAVIAGLGLWVNYDRPTTSKAPVPTRDQKEIGIPTDQQQVTTDKTQHSQLQLSNAQVCKSKFGPQLDAIASISLSYKQDDEYISIIGVRSQF